MAITSFSHTHIDTHTHTHLHAYLNMQTYSHRHMQTRTQKPTHTHAHNLRRALLLTHTNMCAHTQIHTHPTSAALYVPTLCIPVSWLSVWKLVIVPRGLARLIIYLKTPPQVTYSSPLPRSSFLNIFFFFGGSRSGFLSLRVCRTK